MAQINRPDLRYKKPRTITVVPSLVIELPEPIEEIEIAEYQELSRINRELGKLVDVIGKHAENYVLPIEEDASDVRAASLRIGGNGVEITFAQFRDAIDDQSKNKIDLVAHEYSGIGTTADAAKYHQSSFQRHSNGDGLSDTLKELSKYGMQSIILWALNQLIGSFHSTDHSEVTSGKYPPGTEVGGIFRQILQGLIMAKFMQGLSDKSLGELTSLNSDGISSSGIDIDSMIDQAINSSPPESDGFTAFRHSMATNDYSTIKNYSTDYMVKHVGDGFETWIGYLTTRNAHEDNLRVEELGSPYTDGQISLPEERRTQLENRNNSSENLMSKTKSGLSGVFDTKDSCCLLRFVAAIDVSVLDIIRSIIATAIAILEKQASEAFSWYLNATSSPWNIISEKILRGLDALFDKVIGKVLDVLDFDNDVMAILKVCTPVSEMVESVLSTIEYLRNWYHELVRSIGKDIDAYFKTASVGWETVYGIKRAKQLLVALDEMISFKDNMGDGEDVSEDDIHSMIPVIEQSTNKYDVGEDNSLPTPINELIDMCRTLGDWDLLKEKLSGSD